MLDGGVVLSKAATLGWAGGADNPRGTANVSGAGSVWVNSGLLVVGGDEAGRPVGTGTGTITISSGGVLRNGTANLGSNGGAYGNVSVSGANSRWDNSGDIVVGNYGIGIVDIRGGAALTSVRGHVGFQAGSSGSVTLSDAGSSWLATGSMFIGNAGSGTLNILNGAVAGTAGNAYLGIAAGAQGQATVSGAGSVWNITAAGTNLNIGGNQTQAGGSGALSIESGGAVTALDTHLYNTGTLALLDGGTLNGPVSSWGGMIRARVVNTLAGALTLQAGGVAIQPVDASQRAHPQRQHRRARWPGQEQFPGHRRPRHARAVGQQQLRRADDGGHRQPARQRHAGQPGDRQRGHSGWHGHRWCGGDGGQQRGPGRRHPRTPGPASARWPPATWCCGPMACSPFSKSTATPALGDQIVVTGGVALDPGAAFSFADLGAGVLAPGLSFVAIDNDGNDAIAGQFAGLAEGAEISSGANRYVVSYGGGHGQRSGADQRARARERRAVAGRAVGRGRSGAAASWLDVVDGWRRAL